MARESAEVGRDSAPADATLVRRAAAGDRAAFDELIRRHQRRAVAVSYRLLGNVQDALDVTQDAFVKAYSGIGSLRNPEVFSGWLLRIVSNLSLNYRRGRKTRPTVPMDELLQSAESGAGAAASDAMSQSGDPVRTLEGRELGEKLTEALNQLPARQRQAILMFTIDRLPQKEIAEALNCSVEAVKWHVFQGRKKLREMLRRHMM